MPDPAAIGFFDSGVGGMSVMREVRRLLPAEDFLYYADSAYCPYGEKPPEAITGRSRAICDFFIKMGVKLLVVACNSASIAALDALREHYQNIPIVGIEPAVKPAAAATRNKKIGVLATGVTLSGRRFNSLVERFGDGLEVYTMPCPGLVELVEAGKHDGEEVVSLLRCFLAPLLEKGIDTLVLGCTHYPFLRPVVETLAGAGVRVIDTGEAVARQVARLVEQNRLENPGAGPGKDFFFTSGDPDVVEPVVRRLWGNPDAVVERVTL
ncbi:MAG: glutamate racemase [Firmicutes bacterium]|nr:glutamate racemase [Bacillota bacterium]